jgi:hypothetical protein
VRQRGVNYSNNLKDKQATKRTSTVVVLFNYCEGQLPFVINRPKKGLFTTGLLERFIEKKKKRKGRKRKKK